MSTLLIVGFVQTAFSQDNIGIKDQKILFSQLSINEGLSQSTVMSCCQDSLGHLWIASQDGLNRYDGYRFQIYRNNPADSTSIADNIIRKVYNDSKGNLWIGTEKGLSYYDREKDIFRNFSTNGKTVSGITETGKDAYLMVAAGGSIRFFDTEHMKWDIAPPHSKGKLRSPNTL